MSVSAQENLIDHRSSSDCDIGFNLQKNDPEMWKFYRSFGSCKNKTKISQLDFYLIVSLIFAG